MRKLVIVLSLLTIVVAGSSQAPALFNYQGVARNSVGNVLVNKTINLRLSIREGSSGGTVVYSETRAVTTNPFGLFNVQVGSPGASAVTGSLPALNWAGGSKYLQVEIDPNGASSFLNIGTAQLASVPYAYYATAASPVGPAGGELSGTYPDPLIANGVITTIKLADGAVTTPKITDLNVTTGKLADGAVTTQKITFPLNKVQSDFAPLIGMTNSGAGAGLAGINTGTGPAGVFTVNNAASTSSAVQASTNGIGWAGRFTSTNADPKALRTEGALQFTGIGEGANKVLTSDADGNASWQTPVLPPEAWLLNGNSGTVDGTNFIGTTDNVPFNFRVNNQKAGRIDSAGPTFFGYQAGNNNAEWGNTGVGNRALYANTTGNLNTALGFQSLYSNTIGFNNTATGYNALYLNTEGNLNTAYGMQALYSNTEGNNNTALGYSTLLRNTTGGRNTASGYFSMQHNITGNANSAYGTASLFSNETGHSNVAIGAHALFNNLAVSNLVAIGDSALYRNTSGTRNTAVGSKALYANLQGYYNTAVGFNALIANTEGNFNTAVGTLALVSNQTGEDNTAIGAGTLWNNTSGHSNSALGQNALYGNTEGDNNTASGTNSLLNNTTGNDNTAMGVLALQFNVDGNRNTAIGRRALSQNVNGNGNTAIGYNANVNDPGISNATVIGLDAVVNASNKVRIGNTNVTVIEGQVAYSFPSDARFKYNIQANVPGLEFIKRLQPVTYYFDDQKLAEFNKTGIVDNNPVQPASYNGEKQLRTGFLAQDVEKLARELGYSFDGIHVPENNKDHYSLAYSQFIMPLVKSVQEQQQMIDELKGQLNLQAEQIRVLTEKIDRLSHLK